MGKRIDVGVLGATGGTAKSSAPGTLAEDAHIAGLRFEDDARQLVLGHAEGHSFSTAVFFAQWLQMAVKCCLVGTGHEPQGASVFGGGF